MLEEMKKLKEKVRELAHTLEYVYRRHMEFDAHSLVPQGGAGSSDEEELTPEEKRVKKQAKLDRRAAYSAMRYLS